MTKRLHAGPTAFFGPPPRRLRKGATILPAALPPLEEAYAELIPTMRFMAAQGFTLRQIAARLEAQGHTMRSGDPWNAVAVSRVLARR